MAVGESPAVARHRLRLALRKAREEKGLTQRQVAESLDWSLSKVNRIEGGEVTVSSTDLQALLRLLGVTDHGHAQNLTARARASRRRGWWDQPEYRERLSPQMIQSLQFEIDAKVIRAFAPTLVAGAFQTQAYATAVLADPWSSQLSDVDRATRLKARLRRRELLLNRPDPPDYRLVLDESVLLRQVGGPQVLSEQLYDLLDLARANRVVVRISPLEHATVYAAFGVFVIYESGDEDVALLYRESYETDEAVYDLESINRHQQFFKRIWDGALTEDASARLIEARAAEMRSAMDRPAAASR
jgi:transcriptional regulator with XRE-family HTH domain